MSGLEDADWEMEQWIDEETGNTMYRLSVSWYDEW